MKSLSLFLCMISIALSVPISAQSRTDYSKRMVRYEHAADTETLPALSHYCNDLQHRVAELKDLKEETFFLYQHARNADPEIYETKICNTYSNVFLQTCYLIESLESYRAVTCSHGNRMDWVRAKTSKRYLPCKAGCPSD